MGVVDMTGHLCLWNCAKLGQMPCHRTILVQYKCVCYYIEGWAKIYFASVTIKARVRWHLWIHPLVLPQWEALQGKRTIYCNPGIRPKVCLHCRKQSVCVWDLLLPTSKAMIASPVCHPAGSASVVFSSSHQVKISCTLSTQFISELSHPVAIDIRRWRWRNQYFWRPSATCSLQFIECSWDCYHNSRVASRESLRSIWIRKWWCENLVHSNLSRSPYNSQITHESFTDWRRSQYLSWRNSLQYGDQCHKLILGCHWCLRNKNLFLHYRHRWIRTAHSYPKYPAIWPLWHLKQIECFAMAHDSKYAKTKVHYHSYGKCCEKALTLL